MNEYQPVPENDNGLPPESDSTLPPPEQAAGPESSAQVTEMKDQLLRALAEAENTRRRSQKEIDDTRKYAVANFAREMLGVADNFSRALAAVPKESSDPAVKNLITGIEATSRQLQGIMEKFGIKELTPLGEAFDPNLHRVMMEIDSPDQPPGTVLQVLQAGYVIHDRLLREALVAVAKGGRAASPKIDTNA